MCCLIYFGGKLLLKKYYLNTNKLKTAESEKSN